MSGSDLIPQGFTGEENEMERHKVSSRLVAGLGIACRVSET